MGLDLFLMAFWNCMLSTQKPVNRNIVDEGFPCDNLGLVGLLYVNIFQNSRTQKSTVGYAD